MKIQRGAALVEFALIALLFFIILFGIIEFGRAWFTYNTLVEATRRGARVAAVCPADSNGIDRVKQVTIFNATPGSSTQTSGLLGLTPANVTVRYLNSNLNINPAIAASDRINSSPPSITSTTSPKNASGDSVYDDVRFVQVEIAPTFTQTLIIPGFMRTFSVPPIVTTLPSESLGRTSPTNPPSRCCYGTTGTFCSP